MALLLKTARLQTNERFLSVTRMRVASYLRRCLCPLLSNQGRAICGMLARYEESTGIRLLPDKPQLSDFNCIDGRMQTASE